MTSLSSYGALSPDDQAQVMAGIDSASAAEDDDIVEMVAEFAAKVASRRKS